MCATLLWKDSVLAFSYKVMDIHFGIKLYLIWNLGEDKSTYLKQEYYHRDSTQQLANVFESGKLCTKKIADISETSNFLFISLRRNRNRIALVQKLEEHTSFLVYLQLQVPKSALPVVGIILHSCAFKFNPETKISLPFPHKARQPLAAVKEAEKSSIAISKKIGTSCWHNCLT